jgi:hypothetical protein
MNLNKYIVGWKQLDKSMLIGSNKQHILILANEDSICYLVQYLPTGRIFDHPKRHIIPMSQNGFLTFDEGKQYIECELIKIGYEFLSEHLKTLL